MREEPDLAQRLAARAASEVAGPPEDVLGEARCRLARAAFPELERPGRRLPRADERLYGVDGRA